MFNGRVAVFGRGVYVPYFSATPPLAKLSCFSERLTISAGPMSLSIRVDEIDEVRVRDHGFWKLFSLGQNHLIIRHHTRGPNPIIFSAWNSIEQIADALQAMDLKVVRG